MKNIKLMKKDNAIVNKNLVILLCFLLLQCNQKARNESSKSMNDNKGVIVVRQPGEFESQKAVWLIWPPSNHKKEMQNEDVTLNIIKSISTHTKVIVTAQNDSLYNRAVESISKELINQGKVEIHKVASEELWIRDMGPNFVELSNGKKGVVDFNFNAWGYTPHDEMDDYAITMEKYDKHIAKKLGLEVISTEIYSEGGNREVNGKGTLIIVEAVALDRNPGKTKLELEAEYRRVLGVTHIIWLKEGVYEDEQTFRGPINIENNKKAYTVITTGGHIDEFARFADSSTILLAEVPSEDLDDPIAIENKKRLDVNYKILKNAKDQDGRPFKIIRVPTTKTMLYTMNAGDPVYDYISTLTFTDGSIFPIGEAITVVSASSYLNFLISNGVIIGQKYWKEGMNLAIKERDFQVQKILESAFPDREIIMIYSTAINLGGGGVHCITMHEPN